MSYPTISNDPMIQGEYEAMREDGQSHNLAEICALQCPPGISGTDSLFNEGRCSGNQFEKHPYMGDYLKKKAAAAGVDVTGKVYLSSLARHLGDPQAWVGGRGDVQRVVDKENWSVAGAVNRQEVRGVHDGKPPVAVAPDIIERHVQNVVAQEPEAIRELPRIRAEVAKQLAPSHGE